LNSYEESLLAYVQNFLTPHKQALIEKILNHRTRWITVVLENIYQSQNASAVIRTCECYGLQDIHVVEKQSTFETNRQVLKGSHKWMTLKKYRAQTGRTVADCITQLKEQGYQVWATAPREDARPVHEMPLVGKTALVIGNELEGVSSEAMALADACVTIPMFGFTESFNLSATVAILLSQLVPKLHASDLPWQLTEQEKLALRLQWSLKSVRKADTLEKDFRKRFDAMLPR
jgi:tRNA (guanosine-2'-O-)-methyltransferase